MVIRAEADYMQQGVACKYQLLFVFTVIVSDESGCVSFEIMSAAIRGAPCSRAHLPVPQRLTGASRGDRCHVS
jgi:hypothetical protein